MSSSGASLLTQTDHTTATSYVLCWEADQHEALGHFLLEFSIFHTTQHIFDGQLTKPKEWGFENAVERFNQYKYSWSIQPIVIGPFNQK